MRFFPLLPHLSCELHVLAGLKKPLPLIEHATDHDLSHVIVDHQLSRFPAALRCQLPFLRPLFSPADTPLLQTSCIPIQLQFASSDGNDTRKI
jgi:hypothetical protein